MNWFVEEAGFIGKTTTQTSLRVPPCIPLITQSSIKNVFTKVASVSTGISNAD